VKNFLTWNLVSRQELAGWLQHHIAEQKRTDVPTSGVPVIPESAPNIPIIKDTAAAPDVQLVLPDPRKQRKQSKQLHLEKGMQL
jgi:translation initiation factor 2-alpha kinase 4